MKYWKNKSLKLLSCKKRRSVFALFFILFLSTFVSAQNIVYVGGALNHDRVWSSDSIYVVFQDLTISEGVLLTVNPGTTVKIDQGRGILVQGTMQAGSLAVGSVDSIRFMANSQESAAIWRWKGIVFTNSLPQDTNFIVKASITEAEVAIELDGCEGVLIKNCKLIGNHQGGIKITNSKNCLISQCEITGNYTGIDLDATSLHKTTGISIINNYISNENHNIYSYSESGASISNNTIEQNIIQNGNNGIWMDHAGTQERAHNLILKNIFVSNGGSAGYALFLSNDSTEVRNNVFWNNYIAVYCEQNTKNTILSKNSFYQNKKGIVLNMGATNSTIVHNTFSGQELSILDFMETANNTFSQNNLFPVAGMENLISNGTIHDHAITYNFWNTTSDSIIDRFIWDKKDKPVLGELQYKPILMDADTANPVAPPHRVKKQWVDNKVRLSWPKNIEKDIEGYRVYWSNFNRYSFTHRLDVGTDTLFTTETALISDDFAVTAYDSAAKPCCSQFSGHESPYAFAVLYPFAGKDAVICKYENSFQINTSNIPFAYRKIIWSTDGDGNFNVNNIIRPTYHPGTLDVQRGKAVLTMNVQTNDEQWLADKMILTIIDNPVAYAGNDTVVYDSSSLLLTEANAYNFEYVLWQTNGDGQFDTDTVVNPLYTPGNADIQQGRVSLYFFVYSKCGYSVDTLEINIFPAFSVHGKLWYNGQPFSHAAVLAIQKDDTTAKATNLTQVQPDGSFMFSKLGQGFYYLYAVPDTMESSRMLPTYYANNSRWQQAYHLPVFANVYDVDIPLRKTDFSLPEGEGSISGHFAFPKFSGGNYSPYFQSWLSENQQPDTSKTGLPNATILLYNPKMNRRFRFTLTDGNGRFSFRRLPFGKYVVDAEIAGYTSVPSSIITLSPDNKDVEGIQLQINHHKIAIYIGNKKNQYLRVYPNPVTNKLFLSVTLDKKFPSQLKIYDLQGRCVVNHHIAAENIQTGSISIMGLNRLHRGIYFGILTNNKHIYRFKMIND